MKAGAIGILWLAIFGVVSINSVSAAESTAPVCAQVIQPAEDPATGSCKEFPTPCDVPTGWKKVNSCSDTQLEDLESQKSLQDAKDLQVNFNLKKFSSCQNMENVMTDFIKDYYKNNPYTRGGGPVLYEDDMAVPEAGSAAGDKATSSPAPTAADYSETNIQVAGVDESEIVKTDGKYIYYFNSADHKIYVANAYPAKDLNIVKKINIPSGFSNPELFVSGKKLTVVSTKYSDYDYGYRYWYNRSAKTVVVVYDVSDLSNLKLEKYYQVDGNVTQSRRIGKYAYVLSTANFSFPYPVYYGTMKAQPEALDEKKLDADFSPGKILPKKLELRKTSNVRDQNYRQNGKLLPYNLTSKDATTCNEVEYVLPDAETMTKYNFTPNFAILSIIDLENPGTEVKSKVLFGDVSEIHMSLDSLYIASHLYTSYNFRCPDLARCIMPAYYQGDNTLLHKITVKDNVATYKASTIVPGSPMNQYSMDQDANGRFRIITRRYYPENDTNLFVLNSDLALEGSLQGIEKWEDFKSSRFIGNRLYLVTFQQIDPLFTIDLSDPKKPAILGSLKIPGYSTYLHPYDNNHLIGIGYDTKQNQWGGVQNSGVKVDLYDISDFNNPKQKFTYTMGDQGSYSDVLSNPRLFVWYAKRNTLFMPVTLYTNAGDKNEPYRSKDAWQGTVALKIDSGTGIKELWRITHLELTGLEDERKKACEQYVVKPEEKVCKKLIGGGEYCTGSGGGYSYVPPYCYADSPIGEYLASNLWNHSNEFVTRNLYLDNILYTISNSKIQASNMDDAFKSIKSVWMSEVKMNK